MTVLDAGVFAALGGNEQIEYRSIGAAKKGRRLGRDKGGRHRAKLQEIRNITVLMLRILAPFWCVVKPHKSQKWCTIVGAVMVRNPARLVPTAHRALHPLSCDL